MKLPTYFALILLSTAVMASIASAYQGEQLFRQNHRMYDRLSPGGHSIITTKGNLTYMVYADLSRNIRVVKYNHNTDAAETKNLVTNGYQTLLDGHHYFAIGVDRDGYIHVVGDMHHYPFKLTSHVKAPYRPQDNGGNNTVLYWKSRSPHNINQFDFLGANTSKRIKGKGFTYYNFTNDRNGRLYFYSRVWTKNDTELSGTNRRGSRGYSLQRYNRSNGGTWSALGKTIPYTGPHKVNSVVSFWENAGSNGAQYQGYKGQFVFDRFNRIHGAFAISNNEPAGGRGQSNAMRRIMYMWGYSNDVGNRWRKIGGASYDKLGRRADADTFRDSSKWKRIEVSLAVNNQGRPLVKYIDVNNVNDSRTRWFTLNNSPNNSSAGWSGTRETKLQNGQRRIFSDNSGRFFIPSGDKVWHGTNWQGNGTTETGISPRLSGISEPRLYNTGEIVYFGTYPRPKFNNQSTSNPAIGRLNP